MLIQDIKRSGGYGVGDKSKERGSEVKVDEEVDSGNNLQIAWGGHKNVSKEFKKKVIAICKRLEINPNYLMSCIALETIRTFSHSIKNPLATATGLIQFLESTAIKLGTTTEKLAKMTQVEQLDYVENIFNHIGEKFKILRIFIW